MGVWVDSTNTNIYATTSSNADSNGKVRKITPTHTTAVTTFAGGVVLGNDGSRTYGDGKLAIQAQLFSPKCVTGDSVGNIFITESGGVRKVDGKSGIISTITNMVPTAALWSDPLGNLFDGHKVYPFYDQTQGLSISKTVHVYGIFGNTAGDLFYAAGDRVVKVSPNAWPAVDQIPTLSPTTIQPPTTMPTAGIIDSAVSSSTGSSSPDSNTTIIIAVVVAAGGVLLLLTLGVFCYRRQRAESTPTTTERIAYSSVNASASDVEMAPNNLEKVTTESLSVELEMPSEPLPDIEHGSIVVTENVQSL